MTEDSTDPDSEPDLGVLAMARGRDALEHDVQIATYEDEVMSQEEYEAEDTSVEEPVDDEIGAMEHEDDEGDEDRVPPEPAPLADPATLGLKEISNLGKFTVSSHKQGSGVEELRSDDLKLYWQYVSSFPKHCPPVDCLP